MGFLTSIKANKAYRLQQKGQKEEALKLYEEASALVRLCNTYLDSAEQKIVSLSDGEAQDD